MLTRKLKTASSLNPGCTGLARGAQDGRGRAAGSSGAVSGLTCACKFPVDQEHGAEDPRQSWLRSCPRALDASRLTSELERGCQESFRECGPHIRKPHCRNPEVGGAGQVDLWTAYLHASGSSCAPATGEGLVPILQTVSRVNHCLSYPRNTQCLTSPLPHHPQVLKEHGAGGGNMGTTGRNRSHSSPLVLKPPVQPALREALN